VNQPELAADFKHAVPIMIWGMEEGIFTGKKLSAYMINNGMDYEGARQIINGNDQKTLIASYAKKFQSILENTSSLPQWALNMNKYIFLLVFFLSGCSMLSFADGSINYGYDKSNNLIYAKKDGKEDVLKFIEDYTGNPSYSFDFFRFPCDYS
jgi:hypothetical protein